MIGLVFVLLCVILAFVLAMNRASIALWAISAIGAVLVWQTGLFHGDLHFPAPGFLGVLAWAPAVVLTLLSISSLRRSWVVAPIFAMIRKILPTVSDTEAQALDAGTIGFDAQLFSGRPDWERLREVPGIVLTPEEKAFLDGPTTELCAMIDDGFVEN